MLYLGMQDHQAADSIIQGLPYEHELRPKELDERGRMLAYIDILRTAHLDGRTPDVLHASEVDQLMALTQGQYDRPTVWMNNLLCAHYDQCRPAFTGGGSGGAKALPYTTSVTKAEPQAWMKVHPNPAVAWVAVDHDLGIAPSNCLLIIRDLTGRSIHETRLGQRRGQYVWDSRTVNSGIYTIEIRQHGVLLMPSEKLILQQ